MNPTAFVAGIDIASPVCGFLPLLAALSLTSNFPNPDKATSPPFDNSLEITSTIAFNATSASTFLISAFSAIAATNYFLFIKCSS